MRRCRSPALRFRSMAAGRRTEISRRWTRAPLRVAGPSISLRESEMSNMSSTMVHHAVEEFRAKANGQVVLVLQGGGALGAYQGGVYQALHEAGVEPDWIIGTSIGAINASLIAGNAPQLRLPRLREFWSRVEHKHPWPLAPAWTGVSETMSYWSTLFAGIPGFFRVNPTAFLGPHVPF